VKVILTEEVPKLGQAGDVVRVRPGYGRNYLIPQGKALLATEGRVRDIEHKKRVIEEKVRKEIGAHEAVARGLEGTELEFQRKAGEEGKLFGSVTNADIHSALEELGYEVERRRIGLSEPIKQLGEYEVEIRLHREVKAQVQVKVVGAEE
jgi:large subunit ribosomal protein L9